jgi:hypothetical protein
MPVSCHEGRILFWLLFFVLAVGVPGIAQNANCRGIWITPEELAALPVTGEAWNRLKAKADEAPASPNLSDQEDPENVKVLARALVYARTGIAGYRTKVVSSCMAAIGTEQGGRPLALGRELVAYVIAADLVGLPQAEDQSFRSWLVRARTETLENLTLISTHEKRPNNWGTHAGASRTAVAVYLGDTVDLDRSAQVFRGWLGDRASYSGFSYGDLSWQSDPAHPVGINPPGAQISGHLVDGVLPDDQRRCGSFTWPPPQENYVYEALQGSIVQAVILHRAGYPVWDWQTKALLRAYTWLQTQGDFPAEGDDTWQPFLVNYYYGSSFPAPVPSTPGKNVGWTDWTHSGSWIKTGIHGVVLDAATRAPVAGAEMRLEVTSQVSASVQTNSYGCYRFVNVSPGTYQLTCRKVGFQGSPKTVILVEGRQLFGQDFPLAKQGADTVPPAAPTNVHLNN